MSIVFNVTVHIHNFNDNDWMLSLTTYFNAILLFMAYCDSDNGFSRRNTAYCLALIDFCGVAFWQATTNRVFSTKFTGRTFMLFCEMCFLVLERLAYTLNTNVLKPTRDANRGTLRGNVPMETPLRDTFRGNGLTKDSFRGTFLNNVRTQISSRVTLQDNRIFYHGLTLLMSLLLVTLLFPLSVEMPVVFRSVMKNTILRGMFFSLDSIVVYAVSFLAENERKTRGMIWLV